MRSALIGASLAIVVTASTAIAADVAPQIYSKGITRAELTKILTSQGMTVQDATQNEADPWLKAKAPKGTEFAINMYDCLGDGAANRRCNNLQFLARWEVSNPNTLELANVYNQKYVFGRAYVLKDSNTFMFDYSINIKDGFTLGNMRRQVDNWLRVLDDVRGMLRV